MREQWIVRRTVQRAISYLESGKRLTALSAFKEAILLAELYEVPPAEIYRLTGMCHESLQNKEQAAWYAAAYTRLSKQECDDRLMPPAAS